SEQHYGLAPGFLCFAACTGRSPDACFTDGVEHRPARQANRKSFFACRSYFVYCQKTLADSYPNVILYDVILYSVLL
ncbi:hypothetical protein, partial [Pseudomonas syringae]|uniref:hypothetical protein n=1 Tax=Pseudomonas syringae TaxID=317 RepID=UPI001C824283